MLRTHLSRRLRCATSISAILLAGVATPAFAQTAAPEEDAAAEEQAEGEQTVTITGSRIRSPGYEQANPIVSLGADTIANAGVTNLTSFLTDIPALSGSFDSNDGSGANAGIGAVGLNLLDLRNLGTQRTLVLVDGRRHVSAQPGSASVDINTIPIELIENIDVITSGSAVYGADAVSGVVNFVTKRDFEGISMRGQAGISEYGDVGNQFLSVVAGQNFGGGRGNIAVAFEYGHDSALSVEQRDYLRDRPLFLRNLNDIPDNASVPDYIPYTDVRYYDSTPNGAIDVDFDFVPDFMGDGRVYDQGVLIPTGLYQIGGSGTPVATYGGEILPKVDRYVGNVLLNYELSDKLRVFAQGKYARVESASPGQNTFDFTLRVRDDNPFLPANLRTIIAANGGEALVNRDNFDIGRRAQFNTRETYRGVIGAEYEFNDTISAELSYVYGRSEATNLQTRTRFNDRFFAAIDAVDQGQFLTGTPNGNIVCRSNLAPVTQSDQPYNNFFSAPFSFAGRNLSFTPGANSGCVPFNLFSETQRPGAIEWMLTDAVDRSAITQHVVTAAISGDLGGFKLWGDEIGFAVGGEYRFEKSESYPDPIGRTFDTFGNSLFDTVGDFDVYELFAEVRVPIVSDRPFFHDLTVNGAVRLSEYSTIGSTTSFQVSGVYAPVRDLRFRGSYQRTVRAPNIAELFSPQSETFQFITDPCAPSRINIGTQYRAANCLLALQNAGLSPAQIAAFTGSLSSSQSGISGGNPDLQEETATTWTAGIVLQPRFIPGLSISADYYNIELRDAIASVSLTNLLNLCVDSPDLNNPYCAQITRAPGSNAASAGKVIGFRLVPQNSASFKTSGIDFALNYRHDFGSAGKLSLRAAGNYLRTYETIAVPRGVPTNSQNTEDAPEWQVNFDATYQIDKLTLNWGINYFSETLRVSRTIRNAQPDYYPAEYMNYSERFTHDVQVAIDANDKMRFYFGVNNLFGQRPDLGATFYPVSPVGRYFYAGARIGLDKLGL